MPAAIKLMIAVYVDLITDYLLHFFRIARNIRQLAADGIFPSKSGV